MRIEGLEQRRLLAAAGELDPDFGDGGVVDLGVNSSPADIAALPDGRVLHVKDGIIRRFTAAGAIDTTFGGGDGIAPVTLDDDPATFEQTRRVLPLPGGKIIVAGTVNFSFTHLVRLNADGSLDTTFGSGGRVAMNESFELAVDVAVGPSGQIALANETVIRLVSPDGDTVESLGGPNTIFTSVAVQADGKVIGTGSWRSAVNQPSLIRLLPTGGVDTSFGGGDGIVLVDAPGAGGSFPPGSHTGVAVRQQADGKLVVAIQRADQAALTVVRYNADGSVDTTFGDDGIATATFGEPIETRDLRIDGDGNIIVLGAGNLAAGGSGISASGLSLVRFAPDGSLDESFGRVFLGDEYWSSISDFEVQPDGGVLLRTYLLDGPQRNHTQLMRFAGEPSGISGIALHEDGTLLVQGNDAVDVIDLRTAADATLRVNRNTIGKVFDAADIVGISIDGAAGNDLIGLAGVAIPATITGGAGDDRIAGGDGADSIIAGAGYDRVDAGGGHDTVDGGDGRDWIRGDDGNDRIIGAGWGDFLTGGDGDDSINGGGFYDHIDGGTGNDTLSGDDGRDWIRGEIGDDELSGGAWGDFLDGGPGNDFLFGGGFPDQLTGGFGQDTLVGSTGDDVFLAVDNEIDELFGDAGNDTATRDDDDVLSGIEG
jgi:uncharacterized delta-60 repeat protein